MKMRLDTIKVGFSLLFLGAAGFLFVLLPQRCLNIYVKRVAELFVGGE